MLYSYRHSPETRAKMSAAKMGNQNAKGSTRTPEHLAALAAGRKPYSPEAKAKMSAAKKGKPNLGRGNHNRWHVKRDVVKTDCTFCNETKEVN